MNFLFRADASCEIGTGHVMRCLTLADALRARGARCRFVCRMHPGHLLDLIAARGYEVAALPAEPGWRADTQQPAHAAWLGAHWLVDAEQTIRACQPAAVDGLIVDHYAIDARWETRLRSHARHLMVIDDLADRMHDCDLLLDQNCFASDVPTSYAGLLPKACHTLLGPRFALLAPAYAAARRHCHPRDGTVRRVLIFMGGSDGDNLTAMALSALMDEAFLHLAVEVVVGRNHPDPQSIWALGERRPNTVVHRDLPTLASVMARADLMIGGGGVTTWERMCLGLPAIVISMADNQTRICQALCQAGYIDYLGEWHRVGRAQLIDACRRCLREPQRLARQSRYALSLTEGRGAELASQTLCAMCEAKHAA